MLNIFRKWYERYLFEEESILLLVLLTLCVLGFMTIGEVMAPLLASLVLAYLMQGLSTRLQRYGLPQWFGVAISFLVFVGAFFGVTLGLLPLAWRQLLSLAAEMPRMLSITSIIMDTSSATPRSFLDSTRFCWGRFITGSPGSRRFAASPSSGRRDVGTHR